MYWTSRHFLRGSRRHDRRWRRPRRDGLTRAELLHRGVPGRRHHIHSLLRWRSRRLFPLHLPQLLLQPLSIVGSDMMATFTAHVILCPSFLQGYFTQIIYHSISFTNIFQSGNLVLSCAAWSHNRAAPYPRPFPLRRFRSLPRNTRRRRQNEAGSL